MEDMSCPEFPKEAPDRVKRCGRVWLPAAPPSSQAVQLYLLVLLLNCLITLASCNSHDNSHHQRPRNHLYHDQHRPQNQLQDQRTASPPASKQVGEYEVHKETHAKESSTQYLVATSGRDHQQTPALLNEQRHSASQRRVSLRQVLLPLRNAGHLNRMYYKPREEVLRKRYLSEPLKRPASLDKERSTHEHPRNELTPTAVSPNNRGVWPVVPQKLMQPNRETLAAISFGQRKRADLDSSKLVYLPTSQPSNQVAEKSPDGRTPAVSPYSNERRPVNSRVPATSRTSLGESKPVALWSQPDPRRSYSTPVSLVKVVALRGRKAGTAAAQAMRGHFSGGGRDAGQRRQALGEREEAVASPATTSELPSTSTSSTATQTALPTSSGDPDDQLDGSPTAPTSLHQQDVNENDAPTQGQPQRERPQVLTRNTKKVATQQPLVALIRYVPIIMNVPADQLGVTYALAAPESEKSAGLLRVAPVAAPLNSGQLSRKPESQHPGSIAQAPLAPSGNPIQLIEHQLLRQAASSPGNAVATGAPVISGPEQTALGFGTGSGDYPRSANNYHLTPSVPLLTSSQLQAVLSAAQSVLPDASLEQFQTHHLTTSGGHPVLAKLAYIPATGQSFASPQPSFPGSHMTSKALSAYASKLISMLKPSALLSSLGGSPGGPLTPNYYTNNQVHQQQHLRPPTMTTQQIFLLAPPSDAPAPAAQQPVSHQRPQTTAPPDLGAQVEQVQSTGTSASTLRPADLLIDQASKVHSTKSLRQRQQPPVSTSQQPQISWPLMPQVNGLICIQGLIGTPAKQQQHQVYQVQHARQRPKAPPAAALKGYQQTANEQQQQQQQHLQRPEEDELNSFDFDEPRPHKQMSEGKSSHARSEGSTAKGSPVKVPAGHGSKGPRLAAKESPIRVMQKLAASKTGGRQTGADQWGEVAQQELLDVPLGIEGGGGGGGGSFNGQVGRRNSVARNQLLRVAALSSASNFLASDDDARNARRSIIPFTIRDKIDAPASRATDAHTQQLQQRAPVSTDTTSTNSPVQYDEPAESDQMSGAGIGPGDAEPRRSRTTFVSSSAALVPHDRGAGGGTQSRERTGSARAGGAPHAIEISYRKELAGPVGSAAAAGDGGGTSGASRDYSLPVLMASSSPSLRRPSAGAALPGGVSNFQLADSSRDSATIAHPPVPVRSPAPPTPADNPVSTAAARDSEHEPMSSSSSSASSVSAATTAMTLMASDAPTSTSTPARPRSSRTDEAGPAKSPLSGTGRSPGQTKGHGVSSADDSSHIIDERRQRGSTQPPTGPVANETTELLVSNSTPRQDDYFRPSGGVSTITASPLNLDQLTDHATTKLTTTSSPLAPATTRVRGATPGEAEQVTPPALMDTAGSWNAYSHDRSLTLAEGTEQSDQFGRISELLQTNPLDLIDLQNSRSSFELPAQLESLSMLSSNSNNNNSNNNNSNSNNDGVYLPGAAQNAPANKQQSRLGAPSERAPQRSLVGPLNGTLVSPFH